VQPGYGCWTYVDWLPLKRLARKANVRLSGLCPSKSPAPGTGVTFYTDERGRTLAKKSTVACAADGAPNDLLESINISGKTAPIGAHAIQAYSRQRDEAGLPYGGRFFAGANTAERLNHACQEWEERRSADHLEYWPTDEVMAGLETSVRTPLHKHHYHR
jgi:putative DNA methylase